MAKRKEAAASAAVAGGPAREVEVIAATDLHGGKGCVRKGETYRDSYAICRILVAAGKAAWPNGQDPGAGDAPAADLLTNTGGSGDGGGEGGGDAGADANNGDSGKGGE